MCVPVKKLFSRIRTTVFLPFVSIHTQLVVIGSNQAYRFSSRGNPGTNMRCRHPPQLHTDSLTLTSISNYISAFLHFDGLEQIETLRAMAVAEKAKKVVALLGKKTE